MIGFPARLRPGTRLAAAILLAALALPDAPAASELPVRTPRGLPVGCSNVAQDFSRVPAGYSAADFWTGQEVAGTRRYVTDLLVDPAHTLRIATQVPRTAVFGRFGGQRIDSVLIVCYPTPATNARAPYALPDGTLIPRMQRGAEPPLLADIAGRLPLILFSHGLGGSPFGDGYIDVLTFLASEGYVVAAPFHADARFSRIRVNDLSDFWYLLTQYDQVAEMMAIRPITLSQILDALLSHPVYGPRIDTERIGGFGASLGGQSLTLLAGAELTVSFGEGADFVIRDPRLGAIVGYVPYSGQPFLETFGDNNAAARGIRVPYLAVSGGADLVAPIAETDKLVDQLRGSRYLVEVSGLGHTLVPAQAPEILTWTMSFYDAHLMGDAAARQRLAAATAVAGPTPDRLRRGITLPWWYRDETVAVEFYHPTLDHYFITLEGPEAAWLDAGGAGGNWRRTGERFVLWRNGAPTGAPLCRFYGTPGRGPNSHFYTADAAECAAVGRDPGWTFEGMLAQGIAVGAGCPAGSVPLIRAYNNRAAFNDSNHRYMTRADLVNQMRTRGWIVEGAALCVGSLL